MAKELKATGTKIVRTNMKLPQATAELLKKLSTAERKAYAKRLSDEGWTYKSIADELGLTRQAIDQYVKGKLDSEAIKKVEALDVPAVPQVTIYKSQAKRLAPDVLQELKELHSKAKLVRGRGKNYREEAEQFTKLAWEQVQQGVSPYMIAKALGITHGALAFRFVRYGYTTSKSNSKVYRKLTHRKVG